QHRRAVPASRGKVEHIARPRNPFLAADGKTHPATLDHSDLFVGVIVGGSNNVGRETQATEHQVIAHYQLALNPFFEHLYRNGCPVHVLSRSV
ncbi:MAG TPA: hypothetical protein VGJ87_12580, partial [Roseiflexaceae bacterium]